MNTMSLDWGWGSREDVPRVLESMQVVILLSWRGVDGRNWLNWLLGWAWRWYITLLGLTWRWSHWLEWPEWWGYGCLLSRWLLQRSEGLQNRGLLQGGLWACCTWEGWEHSTWHRLLSWHKQLWLDSCWSLSSWWYWLHNRGCYLPGSRGCYCCCLCYICCCLYYTCCLCYTCCLYYFLL